MTVRFSKHAVLNHNSAENVGTHRNKKEEEKLFLRSRRKNNGEFNRYLAKLEDDLRAPPEQTVQLAGTTRKAKVAFICETCAKPVETT